MPEGLIMEAKTSHEPKTASDNIALWVDVVYKITEVAKAVVSLVNWVLPLIF